MYFLLSPMEYFYIIINVSGQSYHKNI